MAPNGSEEATGEGGSLGVEVEEGPGAGELVAAALRAEAEAAGGDGAAEAALGQSQVQPRQAALEHLRLPLLQEAEVALAVRIASQSNPYVPLTHSQTYG